MSQNWWIVGGGVAIILIAGLLFTSGETPGSGTTPAAIPEPVVAEPEALPVESTTMPDSNTSSAESVAPKARSAIIHTSMGDITLKLYPDAAPKTVENFTKLAGSKFYDGVRFHRVIKGFMNQAGDPLSKDDSQAARWGTGGPGYSFADEIDAGSALYERGYKKGVLAMANAGPNTNGSQFFIMAADYPLPPLYTIFGEVTSGLDVVDKINMTATGANDRPIAPITISSIEVR